MELRRIAGTVLFQVLLQLYQQPCARPGQWMRATPGPSLRLTALPVNHTIELKDTQSS